MMKKFLIFTLVIFTIVSCSQNQKTNENSQKAEKVKSKIIQNDTVNQNAETAKQGEGWLGSPARKIEIDTSIDKKNGLIKLKSSKKRTPEEIKKNEDLKRARAAFKKGVDAYNKKNNEKAIDAFKEVLQYDAEHALANYNLGKIYYETGQKELSFKYYSDAYNYNPQDSNSVVAIGLIYFERKDFNKAMEYFNKAVDMAPGYGLAYYNRGTLLGQEKKFDEALSDLNKAAIYSPKDSRVFMNRGLAYFLKKDLNSACTDWNKAAEMGNSEAQKAVKTYCEKK